MARRYKGNYSNATKAKQDETIVVDSSEGPVVVEQRRRGASVWKYLIFMALAFVVSVTAATALISPLGVVVAGVGKVNNNTTMLDMLNGWFFPMFTISIVVAGLTLMALRRVWHAIEARFN